MPCSIFAIRFPSSPCACSCSSNCGHLYNITKGSLLLYLQIPLSRLQLSSCLQLSPFTAPPPLTAVCDFRWLSLVSRSFSGEHFPSAWSPFVFHHPLTTDSLPLRVVAPPLLPARVPYQTPNTRYERRSRNRNGKSVTVMLQFLAGVRLAV